MTEERPERHQERLTTSWIGRGLRVAGAVAKVTARRVLGGGKDDGKATGDELQARLGELKGVMLKAGQMASYIQGSLPPGFQHALAKLQDAAPPMAPGMAERVVADELGRPVGELFASWSRAPASAASIGQVHQATLPDGVEVAVKVQYPGILAAMQGDLRNLKHVLSLAGAAYPGMDAGAIKDEICTQFLAECDYRQELANQESFRALYSGDARVTIPEVFPAYSSARVLTTRWEHARRFSDFRVVASREARNRAGEAIFWFAFNSIFRHGLFNCDPHPGNYLFADDGSVVFLDFGCVKRFERGFVDGWRQMILAALAGDRKGFDELVVATGLLRPGTKVDFDYHYQMSLELYRPFLSDRPFRFTREYVTRMSEAAFARNPNLSRLSMPRDFIFANRLQWGVYSVLATLEAEVNYHRLFMAATTAPVSRDSLESVAMDRLSHCPPTPFAASALEPR